MMSTRKRASPTAACVELLLLVVLLHAPCAAPESITVPTDSIRSAKDVADILGEPPPAPEAPEGFSWATYGGQVNITTNILYPLEGSAVQPQFDVMLEIAATPLGAFKERYSEASHCLSIDDEPPACWAVLGNASLPRFAMVPPGPHTLRAGVTDPTGEWVVPDSWSPLRHFVVSGEPPPSKEVATADGGDGADPEEPAKGPEDVTVDIPLAQITSPLEMSVITTRFVDMTYRVTTPDPESFETHFRYAHACTSLNGGAHACWSLFNVSHTPRWLGLAEGVHLLQTAVTHPNTGEEIPGSASDLRAFVVFADGYFNDNVVGKGLAIDGAQPAADGSGSGGSGSGSGGSGSGEQEMPAHVVLDIDIGHRLHTEDHVTYLLPVQRAADFVLVAQRFCAARDVGNSECVDHIVREIYAKFQEVDDAWAAKAKERAELRRAAAEEARRRIDTPEGEGFLIIPVLDEPKLATKMHEAVDVCRTEHDEGEVGLECLTQQSLLFGMRERLGPADQESLLDFIGNLGAGFGF